jgi:transposase
MTVHVIVDNYATHKHPDVMAWLEKHQRFVFHFTPTSASWLNAIEGFFAKLTNKRLKHGVFRSLPELKDNFLDHTNATQNPLPGPRTQTKSLPPSDEGPSVRFDPLGARCVCDRR